ncbi:MAG: sulfatase-like hydrolase/transferase [Bryobacteraceae bacterium]
MTRRTFLSTAAVAAAPSSKPNLLFIVVDQLSGLALPVHDSNARMPNVTRLCQSGVTFTTAYSAGMTCGPSRASLETGLPTQTHGVGAGFKLAAETPSLSKALAANGYALSHPDGYSLEAERELHERWLTSLGYENPTSIYGSPFLARYADLPLKWKCGRAGVAPEHGFEAYCAQRAMRFLEVNRERPFACFLQLRGPHDPYMVPRPYDSLIDPASLALPPFRAGEFDRKPVRQQRAFQTQGASKMSDEMIRRVLALYYGMAAYSDNAIGQVLTRLEELRLRENTVIALVADHGDTMGRHRMMSKDFAFYEPAIRIPMIFSAPGAKQGVTNADPVSGIDVFPTLCDLMGFAKPAGIAGESLVGRWNGSERNPERAIFAAQGAPGKNRAAMVRTGRYKFARYDDGGEELYDLSSDPNELENLAESASHAAVRKNLEGELRGHERSYAFRT